MTSGLRSALFFQLIKSEIALRFIEITATVIYKNCNTFFRRIQPSIITFSQKKASEKAHYFEFLLNKGEIEHNQRVLRHLKYKSKRG